MCVRRSVRDVGQVDRRGRGDFQNYEMWWMECLNDGRLDLRL